MELQEKELQKGLKANKKACLQPYIPTSVIYLAYLTSN